MSRWRRVGQPDMFVRCEQSISVGVWVALPGMTDGSELDGLLVCSHGGQPDTTDILTIDGAPVVVSVDDDQLSICGPRGGCSRRSLDLDSAAPPDSWYYENEHWDEEEDPDDEDLPRLEVDEYNLCGIARATHLGGRPVVVTGGRRYDFSFGDGDDSSGGIVRTWDLATGRLVGSIMAGHVLGVTSLTTIPYRDGRLIVSTCEAGSTFAWDLAESRRVVEIEGAYNGVMDAASIDGRPIAVTGGDDDRVRVWDLLTGDAIGDPIEGVTGPVGAVTVTESPRGGVVLVSDDDGVHGWDLATRESIGAPWPGHDGLVERMAAVVVGEGTVVVTSDEVQTRFWDLGRGRQLGEPVAQRLEVVGDAGVPLALTVDPRGGLRVWDLARR